MTILTTDRCVVRSLCLRDHASMLAYRSDAQCARWQGWENAVSFEAVRALITEMEHRTLADGDVQLAVAAREDDRLLGDLYARLAEGRIELGVTIAPQAQRQGLAFEALSAYVALLRRTYPHAVLCADIHPDNAPSRALFQKLGFVQTDYLPETESCIYECAPSGSVC